MNKKLLTEVVRILREQEEYYDIENKNAINRGNYRDASISLSKSLAYNSAREILMAALTDNEKILREYDYYWQQIRKLKE